MGPLLFVCIGFLVGIWCFSGKYGATIFIAIVLFIALIWSHFYDFPAPEPNIIGTGTVQYDGKSATYFVVIDSARYRITDIEQRSQPFLSEKMVVTVYTLPFEKEHYTIEGKKTAQDIVQFLIESTRSGLILAFRSCLIMCLIALTFMGYNGYKTNRKKKIQSLPGGA